MQLIDVNCYNCNSRSYSNYDSENGFQLVKCNDCGLLYVNPRPDDSDISKAKLTGVHEGETTIATTGRYAHRKVRRYIKILNDFFPDNELQNSVGTWFDIGCGFGELIEAIEKISKHTMVKGSELNTIKVQSAKKRNLDVDFYDIDKVAEQFDVVSLLNVFSHLPDPVKFLSNIKHLIKPGGELFLETGHTSHLSNKVQLKPYYLPDHLSFANKEILEGILERIGFKIIKTDIYRSTLFPRIYKPAEFSLEILKIIIKKHGSIRHFFPVEPRRDMFIRARLIK